MHGNLPREDDISEVQPRAVGKQGLVGQLAIRHCMAGVSQEDCACPHHAEILHVQGSRILLAGILTDLRNLPHPSARPAIPRTWQ